MIPGLPRVQSQPFRVRWAGWETDTMRLHRHGWQIAVAEDPAYDAIKLMMRHEDMELHGMTDTYSWQKVFDSTLRGVMTEGFVFNVAWVGKSNTKMPSGMLGAGLGSAVGFSEIDPVPGMVVMDESVSLDDLDIFRKIGGESVEVLVDRADMTVVEHLEAIKALQSDRQRELRERARRITNAKGAMGAPKTETLASIISIAA